MSDKHAVIEFAILIAINVVFLVGIFHQVVWMIRNWGN